MLLILHRHDLIQSKYFTQYCLHIRGGDFFVRQQAGEHPKQLNYSRAFGGKDLKMFGLSAEPDISHFEVGPNFTIVANSAVASLLRSNSNFVTTKSLH